MVTVSSTRPFDLRSSATSFMTSSRNASRSELSCSRVFPAAAVRRALTSLSSTRAFTACVFVASPRERAACRMLS
ncbi:hypothetical protein D3C83_115980 [compost metagenome]